MQRSVWSWDGWLAASQRQDRLNCRKSGLHPVCVRKKHLFNNVFCNQVILFCICLFRSPFCSHYSFGHVGTVKVTTTFYVADWKKRIWDSDTTYTVRLSANTAEGLLC